MARPSRLAGVERRTAHDRTANREYQQPSNNDAFYRALNGHLFHSSISGRYQEDTGIAMVGVPDAAWVRGQSSPSGQGFHIFPWSEVFSTRARLINPDGSDS